MLIIVRNWRDRSLGLYSHLSIMSSNEYLILASMKLRLLKPKGITEAQRQTNMSTPVCPRNEKWWLTLRPVSGNRVKIQ